MPFAWIIEKALFAKQKKKKKHKVRQPGSPRTVSQGVDNCFW